MGYFLGFGNGSDGALSIAADTTEAPIDSAASTSGANLAATNPSFAANQMIMVHQSKGSGAGGWEVNQINAYSAGTLTPQITLANTYSSGAQVRVLPQYSSVSISSGKTYSAKAYDGTVGGILAFLCTGSLINSGTMSAVGASGVAGQNTGNGGGFRGAAWNQNQHTNGFQGEGSPGSGSQTTSANGNAGGGGNDGGAFRVSAGGGAGNGTVGSAGQANSTTAGAAGGLGSSSDLITLLFGGGGGSGTGGDNSDGGAGGNGGGIIFVMASLIDCSSGIVNVNGGNGAGGNVGAGRSGGGAGAGGCVFFKTNTMTIGTQITANGGTGGTGTQAGGNGGSGVIRIEACTITDPLNDSTPTSNRQVGGLSWCNVYSQMF